ncbi:MAG: HAD family hydrolase [Planctomycetota bacterium]
MVKKTKSKKPSLISSKNKPLKNRYIKAVLFDLGNTLYDKRQFMESAFKEVAVFLEKKYKLNRPAGLELIRRIWKIHTSHYEFLFKELLDILGIYSVSRLEKVLSIYHHHQPKLKPYPGINEFLKALKKKYQIGLVTDGYPWMQRNKIMALGWEKMFDVIIYAAEHLPEYRKPSSLIYQLAAEKLGRRPEETVYVGDNPYEDFKGARQIGIFTIRVLQGEFKDIRLTKGDEADMAINKITDLRKVLCKPI